MNDDSRSRDAGRAALSAAYVGVLPKLRRIAAGMGFASPDADDILQDVYIEALRGPGEHRSDSASASWLCRVTVNRCLLEYRRRARFQRAVAEFTSRRSPDAPPSTSAGPILAEEVERMRQALLEMDGEHAAVLTLRYFCDFDSREIGEVLQTPPATVRSRLRAARLLLARKLTNEDRDA